MEAIRTAQAILDSIADIRPYYRDRTVVAVERSPKPITVIVTLDNGYSEEWHGLFARLVLDHLPSVL